MKLLLVTPEFPPDRGGIATYLGALFSEPKNKDATIRVHKISWLALQTNWLYPRWLPALLSTLWLCWRWRPDLVCVSHVLPVGTIAYLINRLLGIDYLIFLHGTDILHASQEKNKRALTKKILSKARIIFVNSQATKELLNKNYDENLNAQVLYPGVSFPPANNTEINILRKNYETDKTFNLVFLGRLVARKGADRAVQAVAELKAKYPNLRLFIVGAGPEQKNLTELITKLNLQAVVKMIGPVTEEEKWAWLYTANCLVFPYQPVANEWEGLGISALEAQGAGCPVIATAKDGLREAFMPNISGIALAEGSAEELKFALEKLIQNPEILQRLSRGALSFSNRFSVAAMWKTFSTIATNKYDQ